MKKTLSVLSIALLTVSLTGCGGEKKEASKQVPTSIPVQPLKYKVLKLENSSNPMRKRAQAVIAPTSPDNEANQMSLAATCMGAAKYLTKTNDVQMISVFVVDRDAGSLDLVQLARCEYAPDGKGISGKDNWTWGTVMAAKGTTSAEYRKYQDTWASLRGKYSDKNGLINDEGPITKEVAKKMGKTVQDIEQISNSMPLPSNVTVTPELENVTATAPEK